MIDFPKATYMYWQKRFDREDPDKELSDTMLEIQGKHKDFGYRRIWGELQRQGIKVKKRKCNDCSETRVASDFFYQKE